MHRCKSQLSPPYSPRDSRDFILSLWAILAEELEETKAQRKEVRGTLGMLYESHLYEHLPYAIAFIPCTCNHPNNLMRWGHSSQFSDKDRKTQRN